ncbi:MAG: hypothetical protein WCK77_09525 [Verrucomicrobiota bacterium]
MKSIRLVLVAVMAIATSVHSQVTDAADSNDASVAPEASPTVARIVGNIPDGTPPPPAPPRPVFVVPGKDVLDASSHQQGGRTITLQRIKPIELPPPPEPASPAEGADNTAFKARLADYRAKHPRAEIVSLGASVYRFDNAPPRTLVTYSPGENTEPVTFWSSADFALLSGVYAFVDTDGQSRTLFMMWTNINVSRMASVFVSHGHKFQPPGIPDFPAGLASFTVVGKPPAADVLVPIQSLHDIYNSEFQRLQTAWDGRERARLQREADLKANPPKPKNITLNYWRTETPAPLQGGAK